MNDIFSKYLAYRYDRAGAVTPGQKREVLQAVRSEARRGSVPIDERSVATLDTSDPSVQAVLRGESVSMGLGATPRRRTASRSGSLSDTRRKVAILMASFLVPFLFFLGWFVIRTNRRARAASTVQAVASPTVDMLAAIAGTQTALAAPTDAPTASPTATLAVATPTTDTVLYAPVPGNPGQDPTNPASIEVGGRLFILQEGEVNRKTGLWNPQQPEWLQETVLRKVFALPRSYLDNAGIVPGSHALVRLRNGELVDYVITTILNIPLNEIEVLSANRPSIVILTIDEQNGQAPDVDRLVIVGEVPVPVQPDDLQQQPQMLNGLVRDSGMGSARLRATPSLNGDVIELLPPNTAVSIGYPPQRQIADGLTWVYVQSAMGSGWLAEDLIIYRP